MLTSNSQLKAHTRPASILSPVAGKESQQAPHFAAPNEESIWRSFLEKNRIIQLWRPDFFLIFRYTDNYKILFQQNVSLDLGGKGVTYDQIQSNILPEDLHHIQSVESILFRVIRERKLLPGDFLYKVCGNIQCANPTFKRFMRSGMLIHRDPYTNECIGLICFHNITSLVGSVRPGNFEIACEKELSFLAEEIESRFGLQDEPLKKLSRRELEIMDCIREGMSSKQIASRLCLSIATINTHRQNMLKKWNVPNTAALIECYQRA